MNEDDFVLAPVAVLPRKIIQLVVARNTLLALTDQSEIWVLHGLDALNSGTDPATLNWRMLSLALPPTNAAAGKPADQATW